jgi:hypothetical protein
MSDNYNVDKDRWKAVTAPGPHMPARLSIAVTPSDTLDVTNAGGDNAPVYASALYIGVSGNLKVIAAGDNSASGAGTPVTFNAVPVGWFPVQVRRVFASGTTATNIVGLYHQ